jgi:hypothetical protein
MEADIQNLATVGHSADHIFTFCSESDQRTKAGFWQNLLMMKADGSQIRLEA